MFDVTTGQSAQVALHDAPIKAVRWVDAQGGILATGSWDKTIKVCLHIDSLALVLFRPSRSLSNLSTGNLAVSSFVVIDCSLFTVTDVDTLV